MPNDIEPTKRPVKRAAGFGGTGHEFGKRRPQPLAPTPPPKRSRHIALLVMGTLAVGGTAYALIPHRTCQPDEPSVATPGQPPTDTACPPRSSSSGHGGGGYSSSHWGFFSGSSSGSSTSTSMAESSGGISRGGFGASGHAAGASSSS